MIQVKIRVVESSVDGSRRFKELQLDTGGYGMFARKKKKACKRQC
ncbi:hypothetical protein D1AOALGA4SA_2372 [Olavius algarvensis Delta 1 endosymbiont]|nr:hypothetical protein D1AOALGA4SA_2372 [Olavius algarvensis Delta 1 endosymbiont]